MTTITRKKFQGITNIVKFNWHFYVLALALLLTILGFDVIVFQQVHIVVSLIVALIFASIIVSLFVSYYVYDWSSLYQLTWLNQLNIQPNHQLVNIHAGFDETSILLANKFPNTALQVLDFYNPKLHTEISIKRARKAYPSYINTKAITTQNISLEVGSVNIVFLFFAAHEIRNNDERISFFKQLQQALKATGKIVVTEHLRDTNNFLAYNIGYFHFLSQSVWYDTFLKADLVIVSQLKINPFVTTFILQSNGATS